MRMHLYVFLIDWIVLYAIDIDECSQNETNNCDQMCINTDGSFLCVCFEGYEFIDGTNQCEGIKHSVYALSSIFL